jgi:branched-chain amino acid aminotransferase
MEKTKYIWLDGRRVLWDDAQVHILTHTLHYGLGVFEGIRCYETIDGRPAVFRLHEHIDRLYQSAHIVQLAIPYSKETLIKETLDLLRANEMKSGYLRHLVFIGDGKMGLHPGNNPIRVSIAAWPWGAYLGDEGVTNGIRVKVSSFSRHHVNAQMTKAKVAGAYVNSILAKREVMAMGYDEALMLDTEGYVSEASGENIFVMSNGILKTTPLTSVLRGITRDAVITFAREQGIPVAEERFTRDELYTADEAFFTGTAAEITPIREVDDRQIGTGKPGPVSQAMQKKFHEVVRGQDPRYAHWLTYPTPLSAQ